MNDVSSATEPTTDNLFDDFHIMLVDCAYNLNIGATARAMMNLGFRHLHLVAPTRYDRTIANATALTAERLLDTLTIHETLAEAVADMEEVVGLALRKGKNPAHFITLPEWSGALPSRPRHKTALVFGAEDNGLRQEHLNLCRWVIRIASTEEFSSFNLAQSVLLVLYEITKAFPDAGRLQDDRGVAQLPTGNDFFQLDRLLDAVMQESGFVRDGSPGPPPDIVKNLMRRIEMDKQEMGILLGLFGRIHTSYRRRPEVG